MFNTRPRARFLIPLALAAVIAAPLAAEAQRRRPSRGPIVRSVVIVGAIGYPRYPLFDPWFQYPYQRGRYPQPYGPYGRFDDFTSAMRIEVTPRQAQVFVDGYLAGEVDDFDGLFERLRLRPGGHEITIYLEGYRTIRHAVYLNPGSTERMRDTMERLAAGETSELPPPATDNRPDDGRGPTTRAPRAEPAPARFGTLSLHVQPRDAEILIDGEPWSAPAESDQVAIRLPEGRHRIEVRKAGFARYVEEVLIRRDRTLTLNVSLKAGG